MHDRIDVDLIGQRRRRKGPDGVAPATFVIVCHAVHSTWAIRPMRAGEWYFRGALRVKGKHELYTSSKPTSFCLELFEYDMSPRSLLAMRSEPCAGPLAAIGRRRIDWSRSWNIDRADANQRQRRASRQVEPARADVRDLRAAFRLAQEMGARLGRGEALLRALPAEPALALTALGGAPHFARPGHTWPT